MKLLAILNKEIELGNALNAIAHLTMGLGHRVKGTPTIAVYFGTTSQVREFRNLVTQVGEKDKYIYSDFPHTMKGGDSDKQLAEGLATPEKDLTYFAAYYLAEETDQTLEKFLNSCEQLKDYIPLQSNEKAEILPEQLSNSDEIASKKIVMLINHKESLAKTINAAILCSLRVGAKVPFQDLRLLNVADKDGTLHRYISFHPYPVIQPDSKKYIHNADKNNDIFSETIKDEQNRNILASVGFGNTTTVEKVFPKAATRLYSEKYDRLTFQHTLTFFGKNVEKTQEKLNDLTL